MSITVEQYRKLARKPRKYHNQPVSSGGRRFDSKLEARRYDELTLLQNAGQISDLEVQPRFALTVNGHLIAQYFGDFSYLDQGNDGALVVEDCKGVKTAVYRLKKKLVRALYGIQIQEIS